MMADIRSSASVAVAISASSSPDISAFGLSERHLRGTVADLAVHVLAANMDIAYGGDLRQYGLTELLFDMVPRYTPAESLGNRTRVTNHLAWPVHIGIPVERIERLVVEMEGVAAIVLLGSDGSPMTLRERRALPTRPATTEEWASGLTTMRRIQRASTDARVVLGGQVDGYKGRMPGVAEEALLSLRARQPLFLVGGLGGSARDVAEVLRLVEPWTGSRCNWSGRTDFNGWSGSDLNNGLSRAENETLASSPFLGEVMVLLLRGLYRVRARRRDPGGEPNGA